MEKQHPAANGASLRRDLIGNDDFKPPTEALASWVKTFQEAETAHVWEPYWTRPGLDARSRSLCVLSMLVALGFHEDLEQYLRGVLKNRLLSKDEIRELILQCPGYVGYPRTLAARKIAERLLADKDLYGPEAAGE